MFTLYRKETKNLSKIRTKLHSLQSINQRSIQIEEKTNEQN
jgi:hypothetical protein